MQPIMCEHGQIGWMDLIKGTMILVISLQQVEVEQGILCLAHHRLEIGSRRRTREVHIDSPTYALGQIPAIERIAVSIIAINIGVLPGPGLDFLMKLPDQV